MCWGISGRATIGGCCLKWVRFALLFFCGRGDDPLVKESLMKVGRVGTHFTLASEVPSQQVAHHAAATFFSGYAN